MLYLSQPINFVKSSPDCHNPNNVFNMYMNVQLYIVVQSNAWNTFMQDFMRNFLM